MSPVRVEYCLCQTPSELLFSTVLPTAQPVSTAFQEGLWEHSVLELFLSPRGDERYWEFHLGLSGSTAPPGGWWACRFSDYRARLDPAAPIPEGIRCEAKTAARTTRLTLVIPLCNFETLPADHATANVTAIISGTERSFLSLVPPEDVLPPGTAPDFHRPELRVPVERGVSVFAGRS